MTASAHSPGTRLPQPPGWLARLGEMLSGGWRPAHFTGVAPAIAPLAGGDAEIARQIYRGTFRFAGASVSCHPADVFACHPPSAAWWEELTAFEWLAHFEAADLGLYRPFARNLLTRFHDQTRAMSFRAECRSLAALARHAPFLLAGTSEATISEFLAMAGRAARRLATRRPRPPIDQLRQHIALLAAALALRGPTAMRDEALSHVAALLPALILPDGSPADRNPATLLYVMAELLALRDALRGQKIPVPVSITAALAHGVPVLCFLSPGPTQLAVFQGVDDATPRSLAAVLDRPEAGHEPPVQAITSGFARLAQGSTTVMADVGPALQCASTLAIELFDGGQRIVGNCGLPLFPNPAWLAAASSKAAHSMVEVESEAGLDATLALRGQQPQPERPAELVASPHGTLLKASCPVFTATAHLLHRREMYLASAGHDLRGEDSFALTGGASQQWPDLGFVIRFHLAPGLRATLDRPGSAVTIVLPDRAVWQFSVRGGEPVLEDSLFLATGGAPEPARQIVIRGHLGRQERIVWAFKKLASPATESTRPRRSF